MSKLQEIELELTKAPKKAKNVTVGNTYTGIYIDDEETQVDRVEDASYFFCVNDNGKEARYSIDLFKQLPPPEPVKKVLTYPEFLGSLEISGDYITSSEDEFFNLAIDRDSLAVEQSEISCGVHQLYEVNNTFDGLKDAVYDLDTDFDKELLTADLFKLILKERIEGIDTKFILISTTISEAKVCSCIDSVMEEYGGVRRDGRNPNSRNEIALWVIEK